MKRFLSVTDQLIVSQLILLLLLLPPSTNILLTSITITITITTIIKRCSYRNFYS